MAGIKVTRTTPTQQAMGAQAEAVMTDSRGRKIAVRDLSPYESMRFFRHMGGQNTSNEIWLNMAMAAAVVRRIDDDDYSIPPTSPDAAEARFEVIGEEGLVAIQGWMKDLTEKKLAAGGKDAAKN